MTMTDPLLPPDPAVLPAAAAPAAEPVHPSWDQALSTVPEVWQKPLRDQIRATETEHQRALEAARADSTPPEWRAFVTEAAGSQVQPRQLIDAWNASIEIAQDPIGFSMKLHDVIDQRMLLAPSDPNYLSKREGYRAKQEVNAGVAETLDPDGGGKGKKYDELKQQLDDLTHQTAVQNQQQQERQQLQEAQDYATRFIQVVQTQMDGAPIPLQQLVARAADSLIAADTTGLLTPEAAITNAIAAAKEAGMTWTPGAAAPVATPVLGAPPVGNGQGVPAPVAAVIPKGGTPAADKAAKEARTALMMAAAEAAKGQ